VITATGNHQQHHFQHVVAAAVAAATSVATGHQFQQQFPLHAHPHSHPHPHHNNSPTGSGSNSNNSAGFQRSSISNSLLQFPPPPPPSSQNQAKVSPITNQFQSLSLRFPLYPPAPTLKAMLWKLISLISTLSLTRWNGRIQQVTPAITLSCELVIDHEIYLQKRKKNLN